jgi:hypothetical protein
MLAPEKIRKLKFDQLQNAGLWATVFCIFSYINTNMVPRNKFLCFNGMDMVSFGYLYI